MNTVRYPTRFGIEAREVLALAHAILRQAKNDHAMFIRQLHDEFFIHWINEGNSRARLRVRWDVTHGWVFAQMS
jgi:hypothetical protein